MKKPRHKFLVERYINNGSDVLNHFVAKVVWFPRHHTMFEASVVLDLDNCVITKNRAGGPNALSEAEYKRYYNKYKDVIKNSCTSKCFKRDVSPFERGVK